MTKNAPRLTVLLAWCASLACAGYLLFDLFRPLSVDDDGPVIGILAADNTILPEVMVWTLIASWGIHPFLWLGWLVWWRRASDPDRVTRIMNLASAVILLSPFAINGVVTLWSGWTALVLCVPTTALGLWMVHKMQRFRRIPWRVMLAVFLGGALLSTGFGATMNMLIVDFIPAYLNAAFPPETPIDMLELEYHKMTFVCFNAGVFEELGKAIPVALAVLWRRKYVDGIVSGIVLGAATGLGFNLIESVSYMGSATADGAGMQFWLRQTVGLMGAHTAFAALAGAGIGAATQLADRRLQQTAIICALLLACGSHALNDVGLRWFQQEVNSWSTVNQYVSLLVVQPGMLVILQGPLVVGYAILLRRGLREQAAGLAAELAAEAGTGLGAVTPPEIHPLLTPATRWWLRVILWRRHGWAARGNLSQLHRAQLDLAACRWHRSRGEWDPDDPALPDEQVLRAQIQIRKLRHAELLGPCLATAGASR